MPQYSHPLDQGGVTEYEAEQIRKLRRAVAGALIPGVSTFAVPTTALIKAGELFEKRKILRARRAPPKQMFEMPQGQLSKPGYESLQSARIAGVVGGYLGAVAAPAQRAPPAARPEARTGEVPTVTPPTTVTPQGQPLFRPWHPGEIERLQAGLTATGGGFMLQAIKTVTTQPKPGQLAPP